jgi:predicted HAD superfamily Cof-like phosphohydrolase
MSTNFLKVRDFNISFGIGRSSTPDDKLIKLRKDLITEESDELFVAIQTKNYVEIIDAISDILYVIYGAADSFEDEFDLRLNESTNEIIKKINLSDDILAIKSGLARMIVIIQNENIQLEELLEAYSVDLFILNNSFDTKNINDILKNLVVIHHYMYAFAYLFGFDLNKSFNLVHQSNMSKLAEDEETAQKTVEWYLENEKRYDSPSYRLSPDRKYWVIFNKNTGKALKSIKYHPVNLSVFL